MASEHLYEGDVIGLSLWDVAVCGEWEELRANHAVILFLSLIFRNDTATMIASDKATTWALNYKH